MVINVINLVDHINKLHTANIATRSQCGAGNKKKHFCISKYMARHCYETNTFLKFKVNKSV